MATLRFAKPLMLTFGGHTMTPQQFHEFLASDKFTQRGLQFPVSISVGPSDAMASKLLLWLWKQMPDATQGQLDDVLDSAKWWSIMWAAAKKYQQSAEQPHAGDGFAESESSKAEIKIGSPRLTRRPLGGFPCRQVEYDKRMFVVELFKVRMDWFVPNQFRISTLPKLQNVYNV